MEDYVSSIQHKSVLLNSQSLDNIKLIKSLGGMPSPEYSDGWRIGYETDDDLTRILQALRDGGLAFAGGPSGWPPAAVAEDLRDKGKFQGVIREAIWSGPNRQEVRGI